MDLVYDQMLIGICCSGTTDHEGTIAGLSSNTAYTYYLRCSDTSGNAQTSSTRIQFTTLAGG